MSDSQSNKLWQSIQNAGGVNEYVTKQLSENGFLVKRRETDNMSKRELTNYKKELKEESAERKRLKQEAWKVYQSKHIVHLGEGIYWTDDNANDKWDLPEAEERAAENELPPLDSPKQLADALGMSVADLRWFSYHRDAAKKIHYNRFVIPKSNGTERAIWAPMPKLKEAQRWILTNIVERLIVHGNAHGFLPGRSILSNAKVHTDSKIILKMDLKDFFPTVTVSRVKGVFRKAGYREQVATLLAHLCTEAPREIVEHNGDKYFIALGPRCLPQGAPTSPGLTNTLCLRLDRRLDGLARKYGWRYSRYADDLTFSLPTSHKDPPKLGSLIGLISRIVTEEGFQVHPDKTRVSRTGGSQRVTGLQVNGKAPPRIPRQLKREMRAALHNLKSGKPLAEGESLESIQGYLAYITMVEPDLGRKMLEEFNAISI